MIDESTAGNIADGAVSKGLAIDHEHVRELQHGWYFPYRRIAEPVSGSNGMIVNKNTGKVFVLGSAFSLDRDLAMYDRGYQFARYDLVVLEVFDPDATLHALLKIGLFVTEPTFEHGTVWRIPRVLGRDELTVRLSQLPCVFGDVALYMSLEVLERSREEGYFRFEALECSWRGF